MFYNIQHKALVKHKTRLLARRIKSFDEGNWWKWGRVYHDAEMPRIYVNGKTRRQQQFFVHECTAYDSSALALFPKHLDMDLAYAAELLNTAAPWDHLGFADRYPFNQRTLATAMLPEVFSDLQKPPLVRRKSVSTTVKRNIA